MHLSALVFSISISAVVSFTFQHRAASTSHYVRSISISSLRAQEDDKLEFKDDMPKQFKLRDESDSQAATKSTAKKSVVTKAQSFTFGSSSIDDFKSSRVPKEPKQRPLPSKIEDLNGIPPLKPFQFSIVAAIMALVGWKLSNYLSAHFAVQFVTSDLYPVQRLAIVARNVIVGMTTMGTGFSFMISLGLFGLGVAVSIGVAKGELDPSKPRS
jgi:Protein of unknown function (DUF3082)